STSSKLRQTAKDIPTWRRNRCQTSIKYFGTPEPAFHAPKPCGPAIRVLRRYSRTLPRPARRRAIGSERLQKRGWLGEHKLNPHLPLHVRLFLYLTWCLQQRFPPNQSASHSVRADEPSGV